MNVGCCWSSLIQFLMHFTSIYNWSNFFFSVCISAFACSLSLYLSLRLSLIYLSPFSPFLLSLPSLHSLSLPLYSYLSFSLFSFPILSRVLSILSSPFSFIFLLALTPFSLNRYAIVLRLLSATLSHYANHRMQLFAHFCLINPLLNVKCHKSSIFFNPSCISIIFFFESNRYKTIGSNSSFCHLTEKNDMCERVPIKILNRSQNFWQTLCFSLCFVDCFFFQRLITLGGSFTPFKYWLFIITPSTNRLLISFLLVKGWNRPKLIEITDQ